MKDGGTLAHTVIVAPGSKDDPLTLPQLKTKWTDCLARGAPYFDAAKASACFDDGLAMSDLPRFGDWLSRLRPN